MLTKRVRENQNGIASFIVTFVLCIVITLIVVGFGTISRREQRQAIDEQLSSQAFYAAESKINQLYAQVNANPGSFNSDNKCNPATTSGDPTNPADNTVGLPSGISITCATAKLGGSATFDLAPDQTVTTQANAGTYSRIGFSWTSDPAASCRTTNSFPNGSEDLSDQIGTIRLYITRMGTDYNRSTLANNTLSGVLFPGVRPTPTAKYTNPPYDNMPTDYFSTYPTYSSGFPSKTHNSLGYTSDEYKAWWAAFDSGATATSQPNSSRTSGVSWMPFWNWLADYQAKYGAGSKPANYSTSGFFPTKVAGNYSIAYGDSNTGDDVPQYFQEWAKLVLAANPVGSATINGKNYYVNNDPANRDTSDPNVQTIAFQPGTAGTVTNPVFFGYCTDGTPATAHAEVSFSPPLPTNLQLTFHNLYKNSKLIITGYDASGAPTDLTPVTGGSGGQATIDVTAKAQDVVKRIQVHISYGQASGVLGFPAQALRTSNSICKLLNVTPGRTLEDACP